MTGYLAYKEDFFGSWKRDYCDVASPISSQDQRYRHDSLERLKIAQCVCFNWPTRPFLVPLAATPHYAGRAWGWKQAAENLFGVGRKRSGRFLRSGALPTPNFVWFLFPASWPTGGQRTLVGSAGLRNGGSTRRSCQTAYGSLCHICMIMHLWDEIRDAKQLFLTGSTGLAHKCQSI